MLFLTFVLLQNVCAIISYEQKKNCFWISETTITDLDLEEDVYESGTLDVLLTPDQALISGTLDVLLTPDQALISGTLEVLLTPDQALISGTLDALISGTQKRGNGGEREAGEVTS